MQTSTIVVLACLIAVVVAQAHPEPRTVDEAQESAIDTPAHEKSSRNKRGLLLLKKKLILGALGLKAAKVAAVGAGVVGAGAVGAGVVGAIALKAKSKPKAVGHTYYHHG